MDAATLGWRMQPRWGGDVSAPPIRALRILVRVSTAGDWPAISGGDSRVGLLHRISKHHRCGHGGRRLPHAVLYTNVYFMATARIEPAADQSAAGAAGTPQWWTYLHARAEMSTGSGRGRADHNILSRTAETRGAFIFRKDLNPRRNAFKGGHNLFVEGDPGYRLSDHQYRCFAHKTAPRGRRLLDS